MECTHNYERLGFTKDGVAYHCRLCKSLTTIPFSEHAWALTETVDSCKNKNLKIEIINKSNIDEVNKSKEIYEASTPEEIKKYINSKYPVEKNLRFFKEYEAWDSHSLGRYYKLSYSIYEYPYYETKNIDSPKSPNIDELEDYAIKYGPILLDFYYAENFVKDKTHSIEKINNGYSFHFIVDNIFTYNGYSQLFYYDENAKAKILKRKEKAIQKKEANVNITASLNELLLFLTRTWINSVNKKMKIKWNTKDYGYGIYMKDIDMIEGIYQFDKLLKNPIISKQYLSPFIKKLEAMKTFKGRKGQEKFVEMLPKFSKWVKKKEKLLKPH